ncbi:Fructose-bisphosphate aldolase, chloroplastic [Capsicum baccatum]|uniref:fructose-bisphosphate aldolase n=1 Tax=Capsicum baccatum TaxID=33114 RepID=A0A2G2VST9_CAPBA|nr:Fructose-bisphosphate aldolase, chloroplastic [Capsicum baccatum]
MEEEGKRYELAASMMEKDEDFLMKNKKMIASLGRGLLAMDESNATCGTRLAPIGIENTDYRTLLMTASGDMESAIDSGGSLQPECTMVRIPNGPSTLAVKEAALGLARYTAISQDSGLVPIMDPEGILLKPSMVTPGAQWKDRATLEQVADYGLKILQRRIPPAVPGIMESFLLIFTLLLS